MFWSLFTTSSILSFLFFSIIIFSKARHERIIFLKEDYDGRVSKSEFFGRWITGFISLLISFAIMLVSMLFVAEWDTHTGDITFRYTLPSIVITAMSTILTIIFDSNGVEQNRKSRMLRAYRMQIDLFSFTQSEESSESLYISLLFCRKQYRIL